MTIRHYGTILDTPFPEYEKTIPATGSSTERIHYTLAGQYIATRVKVAGQAGAFYFVFTDRQGSVHALRKADGTWVNGNYARYDAYGGYRTTPATTVNPGISDRGYTGHRMNNTGNDLGLIYMNARYYLPEVGRFISADTIVPDSENPQSYNRYSYALNSPVNFTDPTGHCTSNYEAGSQDLETCLDGWNAVVNYLYGAAFGPGGSGYFPNELISDWLTNADIGTLENLMQSYGIDYGYVYTPPTVPSRSGPRNYNRGEATCQYWQGCYEPVITREEMNPDAFILPGVSGSGAAIWYGTAGGELVWNIRSKDASAFGFSGLGIGPGGGADLAIYFGLIWNLENNTAYEGDTSSLIVDLVPGLGVQVQFSWATGTVPFTGDIWGVAVGPGAGLSINLSAVQSRYSCQLFCR